MAKQLTEQELRQQAVRALSDRLGPVDALRFLASVSREPFDYQQWRTDYFFRTTASMTCWRKPGNNRARSVLRHRLFPPSQLLVISTF
jgi:hypothetical protein